MIRTKGAAEILMKPLLGIVGELLTKFGLKLSAVFMPSERNKAVNGVDKQKFAGHLRGKGEKSSCSVLHGRCITEGIAHYAPYGVDRTLYLIEKTNQ